MVENSSKPYPEKRIPGGTLVVHFHQPPKSPGAFQHWSEPGRGYTQRDVQQGPYGVLMDELLKGSPKAWDRQGRWLCLETSMAKSSQGNCWAPSVVDTWRGSSLRIYHREVVEEEIPPFNRCIQLREPVQQTKACRLRPDSSLILNTQA